MKRQTKIHCTITTLSVFIVAACHSAGGDPPETAASSSVQTEKKAGFDDTDATTPGRTESPLGPSRVLENDTYERELEYAETEGFHPPYVIAATSLVPLQADCGDITVYFETESAQLSDEGKEALDEAAQCIKGTLKKEELSVTGRADPRGTEEYNEKLSRERAKSVVEYLEDKNVATDTFELYARGEEGSNEDMPQLWPQQRRAVVETE